MVRIAIGLQNRGWNVRVISLRNKGPLTGRLDAAGIPVDALDCGGFSDIRTFFRLRAELRRQPADVLFCFLHQANIYGRLAARSAGISLVLSGIRVVDRRLSVVIPERVTRCCVDHYVAVSKSVGKTHARLCSIPEQKMTAVPNGVDLSDQPPVRDFSENHFRLLFVGRLTEQKDPDCLLQAFCRLPDSLKEVTSLTFAGDGPLRHQLEQFTVRHHLTQKVSFLGHRDDIGELMQQATLLVLPSRWEGMPNVVLEAIAQDLPVVATNVDGTCDVIENGRHGWLVPPRDPDQLAQEIAAALKSPQNRQQIAQNARKRVQEEFSWEIAVEKYDSLLSSLLVR